MKPPRCHRSDGSNRERRGRGPDDVRSRQGEGASARRRSKGHVVQDAVRSRLVDVRRAPRPVVGDSRNRFRNIETRRVPFRRRARQVVDGAGYEIHMPAAPRQLRQIVPMAVEPWRPTCGSVLIDAEKSRHGVGVRTMASDPFNFYRNVRLSGILRASIRTRLICRGSSAQPHLARIVCSSLMRALDRPPTIDLGRR